MQMPANSVKVCFVGLYTYSLFDNTSATNFGGAEVRSYLISTTLAKNPCFDVSYVVRNEGQRKQRLQGVWVYPHSSSFRYRTHPAWYDRFLLDVSRENLTGPVKRLAHFPYVRLQTKKTSMHYRLFLLGLYSYGQRVFNRIRNALRPKLCINSHTIYHDRFRIYEAIDADIYCTFTVSDLAAEIAAFCRAKDKKFVLFSGSDIDFSEEYRADSTDRNIYGASHSLCHYSIKNADLIFVQTDHQLQLTRERFRKGAVVVRSPVNLDDHVAAVPYRERKIALWVGKSDDNKQPGIVLDLAAMYPTVEFVMVMNRYNDRISEEVISRCPANVTLFETIPFDEIEHLFAQSFVFMNTSKFEGFPNTFLQAGKCGVPILSLNVDPDGFIEKNSCGIVAHGSFRIFAEGLREAVDNPYQMQQFSENIRTYVATYHNLEHNVGKIAEELRNLANQHASLQAGDDEFS